jgi:hypothetical protein
MRGEVAGHEGEAGAVDAQGSGDAALRVKIIKYLLIVIIIKHNITKHYILL